MKKVIAAILIGAMFTGCASIAKVNSHNRALEQRALIMKVKAEADGQPSVSVGVDLLNARGYIGAWKADPKGMGWATAKDAALAALLGWGYNELNSSHDQTYNDSDVTTEGGTQVTVDGSVNAPIVINVVNGDDNTSVNDDATSGTSNRDMYQPGM